MSLCAATSAFAQTDVLVLTTGERRAGRVVSVDAQGFSVEVQLAPGQASGTIRVPRAAVTQIEFAPDAIRDALSARAGVADLAKLTAYWKHFEPFLSIPRSPAPRLGLRYASLLLETNDSPNAASALALFRRIETESWNPDDRAAARQGRLRGLIATGKMEEAVTEAREVLKAAGSPEVVSEAKLILAKANEALLRKLLEDNPRWEEDDRIRPERHRLYHDTLDFYLYPSLFNGAASEPSARGLWGAVGVYQLTGELPLAAETARDIVSLHGDTTYARLAQDFLTKLPDDVRKQNSEKDAKSSNATPTKTERQ